MRNLGWWMVVMALLGWGADATRGKEPTREGGSSSPFVVHEWGTFTSISGSDGVRLEFRPLVENDLPEFVTNRAWQGGRHPNPFLKISIKSLQRMETPVTYFYTDREREVDVKVGFPKGLLTEFYPPVKGMKPDFDFKRKVTIGNSELDWGRITLIPPERLAPPLSSPAIAQAVLDRLLETIAPDSDSHPHYRYARNTDSAIVHVRRDFDKTRPQAPRGDFFEKFLFYRGVGNFPLPLRVVAKGEGQFEVSNSGSDPLRSLFLVTFRDNQLWVTKCRELPAGGSLVMTSSQTPPITRPELGRQVVEALVEEGLYLKEAEAMVATWNESWFAEEGTRLFYMLPARITDELLPLDITPRPDQMVRVMVGRHEIVSPEQESQLEQVVRASAEARRVAVQQVAARKLAEARGEAVDEQRAAATESAPQFPEPLTQLGRLAEPMLARIAQCTKDDAVKVEVANLIRELRARQIGELARLQQE